MKKRFDFNYDRQTDVLPMIGLREKTILSIIDRKNEEIFVGESTNENEFFALKECVNYLNYQLNGEKSAEERLTKAVSDYLSEIYQTNDKDYLAKMSAGVKAFIAVNIFGEPYQPLFMFPAEEPVKKWWEFWK